MGGLGSRDQWHALRADAGRRDLPDLLRDSARFPSAPAPHRASAVARGQQGEVTLRSKTRYGGYTGTPCRSYFDDVVSGVVCIQAVYNGLKLLVPRIKSLTEMLIRG